MVTGKASLVAFTLTTALAGLTACDEKNESQPAPRASQATAAPAASAVRTPDGGVRWTIELAKRGGDPPAKAVALKGGGWALAGSRPPPVNLGGETLTGRSHLVYLGIFDAAGKHRFSVGIGQQGGQTFGDLVAAPNGDVVLAADVYGNSVRVGESWARGPGPLVARFAPDGQLRWALKVGEEGMGRRARLAMDPKGDVFVAYHFGAERQQSTQVIRAGVAFLRLSADGKVVWRRSVADRGHWTKTFLRAHPSGGVVAAGQSDGAYLHWAPLLADAPSPNSDDPVEQEKQGLRLYTRGYGGGKPRFFFARFDADGKLLWQQTRSVPVKFGSVHDLELARDETAWLAASITGAAELDGGKLAADDYDLLLLRASKAGEWLPPIHLKEPGGQGRAQLLPRGKEMAVFASTTVEGNPRGWRLRFSAAGKETKRSLAGMPFVSLEPRGPDENTLLSVRFEDAPSKTLLHVERWPLSP